MSGPKIDEATLARQKAEQLEKERRARAEALSVHCACVFQIRSEMQIMKQKYQSFLAQVKGIPALSFACNDAEEILDECTRKLEAEITKADPLRKRSEEELIEASKINILTVQMRENCKHILSVGEDKISPPIGRINEYMYEKENIEEKNKVYQELAGLQAEHSNALNQYEFTGGYDYKSNSVEIKLQVSKPRLISYIEDTLSMDYICFEDHQWLERALQSLKDEMSETKIQDTANQFFLHRSAILQNRDEFVKTFSEYEAEVILLSEISGESLKTKDASCFASLKNLKAEIDRIRLREAEVENSNYIRKTIAKVMRIRGYRLQQDVVFKEGGTIKHTIFAIPGANSSGTAPAIHTSYSEDGNTVMFEVLGADPDLFPSAEEDGEKDKKPILISSIGSQSIENAELSDLLLHLQMDLCPVFDEIRKECEKFGVIMRNQSDKKPDLKYNRIITAMPVTSSGNFKDGTNSKKRDNLQSRVLSL